MKDNRKENCNMTPRPLGNYRHYKGLVGALDFFEPTQSGNYKWQLSSESTDAEMQMVIDAIQEVFGS